MRSICHAPVHHSWNCAQTSGAGERTWSVMLNSSTLRAWGSGIEDLCTRSDRVSNFAKSSLPGSLYLPFMCGRWSAIPLQHNIPRWKKLSSRANGCKSCLVDPPCNGKLFHPTNGLMMLPDPAECVEQNGSITTISTPDILDAVFTIPSLPTNLQMNE